MNINISQSSSYVSLLNELLQAASASGGDPQALHPVLQKNLERIDDNLVLVLKDWSERTLPGLPFDQAWTTASTMGDLGLLLQQCSIGNREINLEVSVVACEQALKIITPDVSTERCAAVRGILGIAYTHRIRGNSAENLERAIACFELALKGLAPEVSPGLWAAMCHNMGNAYLNRIEGNKEDNIEQALTCYKHSLRIFQRDRFPLDWAMTQHSLGSAFCRRIRGNPAENYEQGIQCYQNALQIYSAASQPRQWAEVQRALGTAFLNRLQGDRSENIEQAISCFQHALTVFTQAHSAVEWASTQLLLGKAYSGRVQGEQADNRRQAITCFQRALGVYRRDTYPNEWAAIQGMLARADEKVANENTEHTSCDPPLYLIRSLLMAPTWREAQWIVEQHPEELLAPELDGALKSLAMGQRDERNRRLLEEICAVLARCREVGIEPAFEEKIKGVVAREPERVRRQPDFDASGITAESAVKLLTAMATHDNEALIGIFHENPALTAVATNKEALDSLFRRYPDLSPLLGMPSSSFQLLEDHEPVEPPPEFQEEIRRLEYLEDSIATSQDPNCIRMSTIEANKAILRRLNPDQHVGFRAAILYNLAADYLQLGTGDRLYNLRQAIEYGQEAAPLLDPTATPISCGLLLVILGTACGELASIPGESGSNAAEAIGYLQTALRFLSLPKTPRAYAMALTNLGDLYRDLSGEAEENLKKAITCYEEALRVYTPETAPLKHALAQNNLGIAFGRLSKYDVNKINASIRCFEASLRFRTPALPYEYASTMHNLGVAHSKLAEQGTDELARAIQCMHEALRFRQPENAPFDCRKTAMLLGDLYRKRGDWTSAYETYDLASRAAEEVYHSAFIPGSQQAEIMTNSALYDRLVSLCLEFRDDPTFARSALIHAESGKARTFLDQMGQRDFPAPDGVPKQQLEQEEQLLHQLRETERNLSGSELSFQVIQRLARERQEIRRKLDEFWDILSREYPAAQEYVSLRRAKTPSWDELSQLAARAGPGVTFVEFYTLDQSIAAFVLRAGWDAPRVYALPIPKQVLCEAHFASYQADLLSRSMTPRYGWLQLGRDLLEPIEPALEGAEVICFVPHELLHVMPLHALTVMGEPFIARHLVCYAPSLAVLMRAIRNDPGIGPNAKALVMGYEKTGNRDFLEEAEIIETSRPTPPGIVQR